MDSAAIPLQPGQKHSPHLGVKMFKFCDHDKPAVPRTSAIPSIIIIVEEGHSTLSIPAASGAELPQPDWQCVTDKGERMTLDHSSALRIPYAVYPSDPTMCRLALHHTPCWHRIPSQHEDSILLHSMVWQLTHMGITDISK